MGVQQGQFVEVRGRPWLVEAVDDREPDLTTLRLSCIADDAQGEQIEVIWDAEIGSRVIQDDTWSQVGRGAPDSPAVQVPDVLADPEYMYLDHQKKSGARTILGVPLLREGSPIGPPPGSLVEASARRLRGRWWRRRNNRCR